MRDYDGPSPGVVRGIHVTGVAGNRKLTGVAERVLLGEEAPWRLVEENIEWGVDRDSGSREAEDMSGGAAPAENLATRVAEAVGRDLGIASVDPLTVHSQPFGDVITRRQAAGNAGLNSI